MPRFLSMFGVHSMFSPASVEACFPYLFSTYVLYFSLLFPPTIVARRLVVVVTEYPVSLQELA